jgi:hypothetical protein
VSINEFGADTPDRSLASAGDSCAAALSAMAAGR